MPLDPQKILKLAPFLDQIQKTDPALEKKFGQANKALLQLYNDIDESADDAQEEFDKVAKKILERCKEMNEAKKYLKEVEDDVHRVPPSMKLAEFKKKLLKIHGVEEKGKDGQNHDIIRKGSKTTSLGLDGYGGGASTTAAHMRTYLKQLGVSVKEWDEVR
jgi:hypothetical protein